MPCRRWGSRGDLYDAGSCGIVKIDMRVELPYVGVTFMSRGLRVDQTCSPFFLASLVCTTRVCTYLDIPYPTADQTGALWSGSGIGMSCLVL
jgi:hypothetical protein